MGFVNFKKLASDDVKTKASLLFYKIKEEGTIDQWALAHPIMESAMRKDIDWATAYKKLYDVAYMEKSKEEV